MKSFDYWTNVGTLVGFLGGAALALALGNVLWMLVGVVIQNLFIGGVYIGKWHTTRRS